MSFSEVLFYIFSTILIFAAMSVVVAKNPVHSALFLILAFITSAGLWILMHAEFLALVMVLVYVGAVMVLFLFVIMMLNINVETMRQGFWKHFPVAAVVGVLIAIEMILILLNKKTDLAAFPSLTAVPADYSNVKELGRQIYTTYLLPFELAAVLLLVGIVAAIALTHRKRANTHHIDPANQVSARKEDYVKIVKMAVEQTEIEADGKAEIESEEVSSDLKSSS